MECNKNVPKPCTLRFLQCWTVTVFPVWGFLDACAFTALFEADVLMHFVDSFVPVSQESYVKLETRAECCPAASARLLASTSHCAGV